MDMGNRLTVRIMSDHYRALSLSVFQIVSRAFPADQPDSHTCHRTDHSCCCTYDMPAYMRNMPGNTFEGHRDTGHSTLGSPRYNITDVRLCLLLLSITDTSYRCTESIHISLTDHHLRLVMEKISEICHSVFLRNEICRPEDSIFETSVE